MSGPVEQVTHTGPMQINAMLNWFDEFKAASAHGNELNSEWLARLRSPLARLFDAITPGLSANRKLARNGVRGNWESGASHLSEKTTSPDLDRETLRQR